MRDSIVIAFLVGAIIFFSLRITSWALYTFLRNVSTKKKVKEGYYIAVTFFFFFYIPIIFHRLKIEDTITIAFFISLWLFLLYLVGRFWFQDVFSGLILIWYDRLKKGQHVSIGAYRGVVKQMSLRDVTLETDEGKVIILPYSRIYNQDITTVESVDQCYGKVIQLRTTIENRNIEILEDSISRKISCLPWSSLYKRPNVTLKSHDETYLDWEITIYSHAVEYLPFIERAIKDEKFLKYNRKSTD